MKRVWMAAVLAAVLVYAAPAFAEQATVLLRSGERVSGTLEDVHENIVYVRVSLHDQRRIPLDQVVLIDFVGGTRGLPESELSAARAGNDLLLLRSGDSVRGDFVDVRGGEAGAASNVGTHVVFRTESGEERTLEIGRVGRVYMGPFPEALRAQVTAPGTPGAETPTGTTGQEPGTIVKTITVPARTPWMDTGLMVRANDRLALESSGEIHLSSDPDDVAGVAGSRRQRYDVLAPMPQHFVGALIGRIGNEEFAIGDQTSIVMPASGRLMLGVNDRSTGDNRGEFTVVIRSIER